MRKTIIQTSPLSGQNDAQNIVSVRWASTNATRAFLILLEIVGSLRGIQYAQSSLLGADRIASYLCTSVSYDALKDEL